MIMARKKVLGHIRQFLQVRRQYDWPKPHANTSQSINNEFLEWPKNLKHCKAHYRHKMSDHPNVGIWLSEQKRLESSADSCQRWRRRNLRWQAVPHLGASNRKLHGVQYCSRVRVRVRIIFSIWLVWCYAHVFKTLSNGIICAQKNSRPLQTMCLYFCLNIARWPILCRVGR